ncbi:MAG: MSCRAMM family protein, partial [Planctomycetaceae bacterium]
LEFFANAAADPSGFGEGERFLGAASVTTDLEGFAAFDVLLAAATSEGEFITATATDSGGNTSEFSAAVTQAVATGTISGVKFLDGNANGIRDFDESAGGESGDMPQITLAAPGPVVLMRNDDSSTGSLDFGFTFDFFSQSYDSFFINNNGNITFAGPFAAFLPEGFPQSMSIIAPFWADVDTRGSDSGEVHLAQGTSARGNAFVQIDWLDVGYFSQKDDKLNDFTLYIEDDPLGDLVAFVYRNMEWTSGDIDGEGGFGGAGAQIGFDAGDGENFISLGRPATADALAGFAHSTHVFRTDPAGTPTAINQEPGLEAFVIRLLDSQGVHVATSITGADGSYTFTNVMPGTYTVVEVFDPNVWDPTSPDDGTQSVSVAAGQTVIGVNFGNRPVEAPPTGEIRGMKWSDRDGDGQRDAGEPGVLGITIYIDANANATLDPGELSTMTDAAGNYVLSGLAAGTYFIRESVNPAEWRQTFPGAASHTVALLEGQIVDGIDFGNQSEPDGDATFLGTLAFPPGATASQTISHSLTIFFSNDSPDFRFDVGSAFLAEGQRIEVTIEFKAGADGLGGTLDPLLTASVGGQSFTDDDGGDSGLNSRLVFFANPGDALFLAASGAVGTVGPGLLEVSARIIQTDDGGRGFETATETAVGTNTRTRTIDDATDADFFTFTAEFDGQVVCDPLGSSVACLIYDADGKLIGAGGVTEAGVAVPVFFTVTQGAQYFIQFVGAVGDYQWRLERVPDDLPSTIDAAAQTAGVGLSSISGFTAAGGVIESLGDVDVFRVVLTETGRVRVNVRGASLDPSVTVFNGAGEPIAFRGDISSANLDTFSVFSGQAGDVFFVTVGGEGDDPTGAFQIDFSFQPPDPSDA